MRIAGGWDHRGRVFREDLKRVVEGLGHEFVEMGATTDESSDYPDFAFKVAEAVGRGDCERGVLLCGTGNGMAIAANKVKGVRAGIAWTPEIARLTRAHNHANVLSVAEEFSSEEELAPILEAFLSTDHEGGRHQRRVDKMIAYENKA